MEAQALYAILVFIAGLLVGSFLNVVILRLNTGETLGGRSHCGACGKTLSWFELIPIISFIFQRGRCRSCASRLSRQYPTVELLTALMFLVVYVIEVDPLAIAYYWFIFSVLLVVAAYDLRHTIVPEQCSYTLIGLGVLAQAFSPSFFSASVGIALFSFFGLLWKISDGKWMGFGDAKLVLGIGWLFEPLVAITGVMVAFWVAAIVGIALLFLRSKRFTLKSEIPFAPFLALGTFIAYALDLSYPYIIAAQ